MKTRRSIRGIQRTLLLEQYTLLYTIDATQQRSCWNKISPNIHHWHPNARDLISVSTTKITRHESDILLKISLTVRLPEYEMPCTHCVSATKGENTKGTSTRRFTNNSTVGILPEHEMLRLLSTSRIKGENAMSQTHDKACDNQQRTHAPTFTFTAREVRSLSDEDVGDKPFENPFAKAVAVEWLERRDACAVVVA